MYPTLKAAVSAASLLVCLLVGAPRASAAVINVDFQDLGAESVTYSGFGAAPSAGTVWNGLGMGTGSGVAIFNGLVDSTGAATGVGIEVGKSSRAVNRTASVFAGHAALDLLAEYVFVNSGSATNVETKTVTLTGLNPAHSYALYLYGVGDRADQNTQFTVGSLTQVTAGPNPATTSLTLGEDYVVFAGVAPDLSGRLAIRYANVIDDGSASRFAAFNGLQVVSSTPEPGAAALAALAGAFVTLRRRR